METIIKRFNAFKHDQNDTGHDGHDDDQIEDSAFLAVRLVDDLVQGSPPVAIRLLSFQVLSIFLKYRNFSEPDNSLYLMSGKIFFYNVIL